MNTVHNTSFDLNEFIETSNKAFKKANKARRRVLIAKDVIMRLKMKNIQASINYIIDISSIDLERNSGLNSFKELLNNNDLKYCKVCAKGALFCSIIGRTNKYTLHDAFNNPSALVLDGNYGETLLKYFTDYQIDMIETAYEGQSYLNIVEDYSVLNRCREFYELFHKEYEADEEKRLIAICENIIKNKGEFIP